jgi:hypothetical protein
MIREKCIKQLMQYFIHKYYKTMNDMHTKVINA